MGEMFLRPLSPNSEECNRPVRALNCFDKVDDVAHAPVKDSRCIPVAAAGYGITVKENTPMFLALAVHPKSSAVGAAQRIAKWIDRSGHAKEILKTDQ